MSATVLLGDGGIGYLSAREDDCFRPCVATCLQVPIKQVPDPKIDERRDAGDSDAAISGEGWDALVRWLHERGLEMVIHDDVPNLRCWIAVCRAAPLVRGFAQRVGASTSFTDHCLVMCRSRVILDPASGIPTPLGSVLRTWLLGEIAFGISFTRKE